MNSLYVFRAALVFLPWGTCVLLDWALHKIGLHPGPWSWKRAVVTFGIGSLIALSVIHHFDPEFFTPP